MSSLQVKADISASTDLLGKVVTDLQTGVAVGSTGAVTGTLKYVTGYTGFSGDTSLQKGNYLALHATCDGEDSIVATYGDKTTTLTDDGILIVRVADKTKPLSFTATKGGFSYTRTYDLSGLTLEEESE